MERHSVRSEHDLEIFKAIVENAIDGILLADVETRKFVLANESIQKLLGYSQAELLSLGVDEIHPEDRLDHVLEQFYKQSRGEITVARNLPVKRKDGSVFYADISSAPIKSGDKSYMIGFFHDRTELIDAERSLRKTVDRLEILSSITAEISSSLNTDTVFRKAVELSAQLIGGDGGSLAIYDSDYEVMRYPYHYNMPENMIRSKAARGTGIAERVMLEGSVMIADYPAHPRALKEFVDAGLKVLAAVPVASKGQNIGALGIFGFTPDKVFSKGDVKVLEAVGRQVGIAVDNARLYERTQQHMLEIKRIEQELREREEKFRSIVENSFDVIITMAVDGIITYVSPAITRLGGYAPEEMIGNACWEYLPDADQKKIQLAIDQLKDRQSVEMMAIQVKKKDGAILDLEANASPMVDDQKVIGAQLIFRDVTEKKQLEKQLLQKQKLESIGTLTAGITHDFNNILSIIIGNTELAMASASSDDRLRKRLDRINAASFRARNVVRQLLQFSRNSIEERNRISPIPLIRESLDLLKATIPRTIEVVERLPNESYQLTADATQIQQVLINLCTNAIHAMSEHGGIMEIRVENLVLGKEDLSFDPDLVPGKYVCLAVSDTGHGMNPQMMQRIFDPYYTTKALDEGTGMGLAVVHGIVKNHGGGIQVASSPGRGATFSIYLPAAEKGARDVPKVEKETKPGNERILFVDDEQMLVELARESLMKLGYQVTGFSKPMAALELFSAHPDQFDIVVTDMTMPKMTGDRLATRMMAIRPDLPIILCTGYHQRINEESAKKLGIAGYIEKPFKINVLAETIRRLLGDA